MGRAFQVRVPVEEEMRSGSEQGVVKSMGVHFGALQ